jgi:hypothetical protein
MGLWYTFTFGHANSLLEIYIVILRATIIIAIALSLIVSLDRIWHVYKYVQVQSHSLELNNCR